ncbi:uncharacterized protein LOC119369887 [Jatropha curcas]|uniref:uncharacterized protein LOC119369887 n=1 Tax=Jatropha curcas TaxID=180498 RepID=UPI001893C689|nr:uncharacterized protein LOC119369887 [Jatropha curcas]
MVSVLENEKLDHDIKRDHVSRMMLTEYFRRCSTNAEARELFFREFFEHYVWNKQGKVWSKWKKRQVIGRVNTANPIERERSYLRLLVSHVKGPQSFDSILTVDDFPCQTFKDSATRRGLFESNQSASHCMGEAVAYQMP